MPPSYVSFVQFVFPVFALAALVQVNVILALAIKWLWKEVD